MSPLTRQVIRDALERAAMLHESISTHCDHDPRGDGGGAMGAIIRYRDAIRELKEGDITASPVGALGRCEDALRWYEERASALVRYSKGGQGDAILAVMAELTLDGGKRAARALGPVSVDASPR